MVLGKKGGGGLCFRNATGSKELHATLTRKFWLCVHCDLDIGVTTFDQGHDAPLGLGQ